MKTIINELTAMIQARANIVEQIENNFIDENSIRTKDDLNKEIDALNIAIKAIQHNKPKRLKVITEDDIGEIGEI